MKDEPEMNTNHNTILEQAYLIAHSPDVEELPPPVLKLLRCILMPDGSISGLTIEQAIAALQQAAVQKLGEAF